MKKIFTGILMAITLAVLPFVAGAAMPLGDGTDSMLLDAANNSAETFLTKIESDAVFFSNYSAGENNADRYFKIFVYSNWNQEWHEWDSTNLPQEQSSVVSVKRFGSHTYVMLSTGGDAQRTEIWKIPGDRMWQGFEQVADLSIPYGNAVMARFNKNIHIYGVNPDGELKAWKLKAGQLLSSPVRHELGSDASFDLNYAAKFRDKVIIIANVDDQPQLLKSLNGKKFISVDVAPFNNKSNRVTAFHKRGNRMVIGVTGNNSTSVWKTKKLKNWNRIKVFSASDDKSHTIDSVFLGKSAVHILKLTRTIGDPAHPTMTLYKRKNKEWRRRYQFTNIHSGSDIRKYLGQLQLSMNHGDGPTLTTMAR